jgi:hypothetical protein
MGRVQYPTERIDEALSLYAQSRHFRTTAEQTGIGVRTLKRWVLEIHTDRYLDIVDKLRSALDEELIGRFRENTVQATTVTAEALKATSDALAAVNAAEPRREAYEPGEHGDELWRVALDAWLRTKAAAARDASQLSSAARNASTVAGIATDKSLVMAGKPNQITQHDGRDLDDILRNLNELVPGLVIDSTAEEVASPRALPAA